MLKMPLKQSKALETDGWVYNGHTGMEPIKIECLDIIPIPYRAN